MEPHTGSDRAARPLDRIPPTVIDAVRGGILDAELAGLLWTVLDGGVPVVVAGPATAGPKGRQRRADLVDALLDLVPPTRGRLLLDGGTEDFTWLADAERLGWRRSTPAARQPADPHATVIVAGELGAGPPADLIGDRARLVIRAIGQGFGLLASIEAAGLEQVLATLRHRPIFLTDDELSNLGIVLVLGPSRDDEPSGATAGTRVAAAHYVRPLARDVHGHTQRLPPAVLSTWDEPTGRFEHFAWGIAGELADRVGRTAADFTAESDRRTGVLAAHAADLGD